jgi:FKBP-type peptidyl-prolyl cis-trans isomerase FkpA
MQKTHFNNWLIVILSLFFFTFSCAPEEEERTSEMEWEELNALLKKYENEGYDVDTTDLSVFYVLLNDEGQGPLPEIGDSCFVSYIGFLPGGKKFEDSKDIFPKGIWYFSYDVKKEVHEVIGLTDGIGYLNKGAEAEIIIPSNMAYGSKGTKDIPPYTTLIYRVKVVDLRPLKRK